MIHLTAQQLSSHLDGQLNEASAEIVRRHLDACEECTRTFAALEEQEEILGTILRLECDELFVQELEARIEGRIRNGAASLARATAAPPQPPVSPASDEPARSEIGPRPPAVTLQAASPPARPARPPERPRATRSPRRRAEDRPASPAIPLSAALILVVIAGSAGVVVSRTTPVAPWVDELWNRFTVPDQMPAASSVVAAPSATSPQEQAWQDGAVAPPANDPATTSQPDPTEPTLPAQALASPPSSTESTGPPTQVPVEDVAILDTRPPANLIPVRRVTTVVETTVARPSIPVTRHIAPKAPPAPPGPDSVATLQRVAHARFRAWSWERTPTRAAAAEKALADYLRYAPMGTERTWAEAWRIELRAWKSGQGLQGGSR